MKQLPFIGLSFFLIFSSACASKTQREWDIRKSSPQFLSEKAAFKQKLGGKAPCWNIGLDNFLMNRIIEGNVLVKEAPKPSPMCLYPSSRYGVSKDDFMGVYYNKGAGQANKQLKVLQIIPEGFLVESPYSGDYGNYPSDKLIFIQKTDQSGLIDGSFLDEQYDGSLHEYIGTYTYKTTFGSKTIYSFRKVSSETIKKAYDELIFYNPYDELYAQLGLWDELEKLLRSPDRVQILSE
jgi:hypothetical protein